MILSALLLVIYINYIIHISLVNSFDNKPQFLEIFIQIT